MPEPLLILEHLSVEFQRAGASTRALSGIDLNLAHGEILGLMGTSGSGKSTLAQAIPGLLPAPPACRSSGQVRFNGQAIEALSKARRRALRGSQIALIGQDPRSALNPVRSIGSQMVEIIRRHRQLSKRRARDLARASLEELTLPDPARCLTSRPHQLSGGQCQRVLLALALACRPQLLIADEPTSALDVTTQSGVLDRLIEFRQRSGAGLLLISHDPGVIATVCDRVAVLDQGRLVECAEVVSLFHRPAHPATQALLETYQGIG